MAQNSNNNTSLDDAVRHVNIAFENFTLAMEKIDEAKNEDEHSQTTRVFRVRQNAIRAISNAHRLHIPSPSLTVDFYNALRAKLDISDELQQNQFQGNHEFKSPLDFVNILVSNHDANGEAVKKLFEKQCEIKWHTKTGDPDPFSFYKFCKSVEDAGGEDVMTYDTRRAHVISKLYQTQEKLRGIRGLAHQKLCPPIYVRSFRKKSQWATWTWKESKTWELKNKQNIDWITNKDLKNYITDESKTQNERCKDFPHNNQQLYWLVIEEDDPNLEQAEDRTFKTQVYVGRAKNGVRERWLSSGTSHCKKMQFARDVMCNMLSFDPTALRSEQLVDLRVLLHKACNPDGSKSGLFIMDEFPDNKALVEAEGNDIDGIELKKGETSDTYTFRVTDMKYGMNL